MAHKEIGRPEAKSLKAWSAPKVESVTAVAKTRAGILAKPGVENVVYTPS